jgi:uroporphyrin-III C-methyltransferase
LTLPLGALLSNIVPLGSAKGDVAKAGKVYLVGGGPGAEDLITVRGYRLLMAADLVVTDRIGPVDLLNDLPESTEVIDVSGLTQNNHLAQREINNLLVDAAREGKNVVRLKVGDPNIFGGGGEEAFACEAAGIDFEVVPGITSAIAAPAAAGIPLTHRGIANGFTVVTGDEEIESVGGSTDHTLVILMGLDRLRETSFTLAAGLRGADCPVAIIESGFTKDQKVVVGTLANIWRIAETAGIKSPAVIVVGDVVRLSPHYLAELEATFFKPERS